MDSLSLDVDDPVRAQVGRALSGAGAAVAAFCAFALLTTQVKSIRAGSPWQDDPYDAVVSFTAFLVPGLAALVAVRVLACRADRPLPVRRIRQLLAAATLAVVLAGLTIGVDAVAAATRADAALWNGGTAWLVASLVPVGAACLLGWWLLRRAAARLPVESPGTQGDWLDDVVPVVDVVSERLAGRPAPNRLRHSVDASARFVRRHVAAVALACAAAASLSLTTAEALGEGWTSPLLFVTAWAIGTGGFLAAALIANAVLHVAVPPESRPAESRRSATTALSRAAVVGALALPVAAGFREAIWTALGRAADVDTAARFAAVTFGTAAVAFLVAVVAGLALPSGRRDTQGDERIA